jgi:uncharacterized membrane protein (UPF0136 family)
MIVASVFLMYGLLLYAEAGISFQRSQNRQLMIPGVVAGTILLVAAVLVGFQMQVQVGASIGVGATLAMLGNFGARLTKTKKFMPAGLMMVISVVAVGILATQVFTR